MWSEYDAEQLTDYILTGEPPGKQENIIPYDPQVRELIAKQWAAAEAGK